MRAKTIKGTSPEEVTYALKQATVDGFAPTLAVVFLSVKQDREAITNILDKSGIAVFGATTNFPRFTCYVPTALHSLCPAFPGLKSTVTRSNEPTAL
jgi:hypothetical protein